MSKPKLTTAIVMISPSTAIQRSWMSCRMFSSPVESSKTGTPLCALRARFIADPEPYCASYHECKRIPGDCVDEVAVVKGDDGEAGYRDDRGASGYIARGSSRGVDEIRRHVGQPARRGDRLHVARIPVVRSGIVVAQEGPARFGDAKQASDHVGCPAWLHRASGNAVPILRRNESPVDHHDAAICRAQRRQHPVAGAKFSNRLHQRLGLI